MIVAPRRPDGEPQLEEVRVGSSMRNDSLAALTIFLRVVSVDGPDGSLENVVAYEKGFVELAYMSVSLP